MKRGNDIPEKWTYKGKTPEVSKNKSPRVEGPLKTIEIKCPEAKWVLETAIVKCREVEDSLKIAQ